MKCRRTSTGKDRAWSSGQRGGHPATTSFEVGDAHGIDPAKHGDQPTPTHPTGDEAGRQACPKDLLTGDHSMLEACDPGNLHGGFPGCAGREARGLRHSTAPDILRRAKRI